MEGTFTVERAARILACHPATVYRLIADGWLKASDGWPERSESTKVSEESLFKFVVVDRLRGCPERVLRKLKRNRKKLSEIFSQCDNANRYSMDEGTDKAESPPPNALPREILDRNHAFAEQHQFSFGWKARQLAPHDPALQDDLVQEMSLAVLECKEPGNFEFVFERATSRAIDYLKYEWRRGMRSLKKARHMSDRSAEKMDSLNEYVEKLLERGVPDRWIWEVFRWLAAA